MVKYIQCLTNPLIYLSPMLPYVRGYERYSRWQLVFQMSTHQRNEYMIEVNPVQTISSGSLTLKAVAHFC